MIPVDLSLCSHALKTVTDTLHQQMPAASGEDVPTAIRRVKQVSQHASDTLRQHLSAHYPDIAWDSDVDDKPQHRSGRYWLYDPIDGAYHYVQGMPMWSASLALMEDGQTLAAWVYEPAAQEMFVAQRHAGATLNGQPIHCSNKSRLKDAVVGTALPPFALLNPEDSAPVLARLGQLWSKAFVVRIMGASSLQLAYVAAGRLDAFQESGRDLEDWLAGALLVQEAGGKVSDERGAALTFETFGIVAGPAPLQDALLKT